LHSKRGLVRLLAMFAAFTLVVAACGDDDDDETTDTTEADAGGSPETTDGDGAGGEEVSGEVNISGSSTVEPISTRVAELFEDVSPDVVVNVDGPGTGDGFVLFCDGETDISDASRAIAEDEVLACEENGVEFIELKVGVDGLSVLTNPANESVECLSFADLYALSGPESQGFGNWTDAQPIAAELESTTEFPDAPLDITAPGEESGTYDSYVELVLEDIAEERSQELETRPDYQSSGDDNIIIQGIEGSDSSFGWVGFAFAQGAGDAVKQIAVSAEPGGECVSPTPETIADNSYPISRPLFIYVNAANVEDNPALGAYVDYYVGDGIAAVEDVGYVALADDELGETQSAWAAKETGTRQG